MGNMAVFFLGTAMARQFLSMGIDSFLLFLWRVRNIVLFLCVCFVGGVAVYRKRPGGTGIATGIHKFMNS